MTTTTAAQNKAAFELRDSLVERLEDLIGNDARVEISGHGNFFSDLAEELIIRGWVVADPTKVVGVPGGVVHRGEAAHVPEGVLSR